MPAPSGSATIVAGNTPSPGLRRFHLGLVGLLLLYFCYGLHRFSLGIDFTDEGVQLAWPLRTALGETPFASELMVLLRPAEAYLGYLFRLHPGITLYEFRLVGWSLHLLGFAALAAYLFRLGASAALALLLGSFSLFACNIFGNASPNYNTLAANFLLLALCARGRSFLVSPAGSLGWELVVGGALFVATFAHPALGLVAAVFLLRELGPGRLLPHLAARRLAPAHLGMIFFLACWSGLLVHALGSGAAAHWWQRLPLARALMANPGNQPLATKLLGLLTQPFAHSVLAAGTSFLALGLGVWLYRSTRTSRTAGMERAAAGLALVLIISVTATLSYDPGRLSLGLGLVGLVLLASTLPGMRWLAPDATRSARLPLLLAGFATGLFALTTFYFSADRSWTSGLLGLPFVFGAGLTLLLKPALQRKGVWRVLTYAALGLAVAGLAGEHYRSIYRDAPPVGLVGASSLPKLAHIRSTPARMQAMDELYAYLHPQLARGEPLLVYDDCPLLYYLFDCLPAYSAAWAAHGRYSPETLVVLDRDFRAKPLPRFVIRTLVDVSHVDWASAPRTHYDDYPLNETVMANYERVRTIHPFEVWRLRAGTH